MLKICMVHNRYQQRGGEDEVFANECALLRSRGHEVLEYVEDNARIPSMSRWSLGIGTIWSRPSARRLAGFLAQHRPDVAHFHNTFPLLSPSVYSAARSLGIPVVQTLHNYRLLCCNGVLMRDGHVCEDCVSRTLPWPGVLHSCYRSSAVASATVSAMSKVHSLLGTWREMVHVYIAASEFSRRKFVDGGLPDHRVAVKPNFVITDPGTGEGSGPYALYVGRLSPEKGVSTLIAAWKRLGERLPLVIAGDGPESQSVREAAQQLPNVEWLGWQPKERIWELMKGARLLIIPSVCYENFPAVLAEAFAVGLVPVASNLGSLSSIIEHRRTGLHFQPADAEDLVRQVDWLLAHPGELEQMRRNVRLEYEAKYTAETNYRMLIEIYQRAIAEASSAAVSTTVSCKGRGALA